MITQIQFVESTSRHTNRATVVCRNPKKKHCKKNKAILKLLEGLVVQVETRVSSEVQLLELWRQILRQSDLTQLITTQIHTLTRAKTRCQSALAKNAQVYGLAEIFYCLVPYFHLHQLHDLRKDLNGVRVGNQCVHAPAVHNGGGDRLQHVATEVHLLQLLQLGHFTESNK